MKFEDVFIRTSDNIALHGWLMLQDQPMNKNTIVFFHENAGNLGMRMEYFQNVYTNLQVNFLAVSYRGYGQSEGKPTESGIKCDAKAVYTFLEGCEKINKDKIFILGRSLGGAVAINLMHHLDTTKKSHLIKGVIIENTFTSISDMAEELFGFLKMCRKLKELMLKIHWESILLVDELKTPIMFITGSADQFVPAK